MKRFTRICEIVSDFASGHFSGWLIVLAMVMVVVEVVSRYGMHQALGVADELSAYMLVVISLVGLAYVSRVRGHIRITFIFNSLRLKVRQWLRVVTLILSLIFYIILGMACHNLVMWSFLHNAKSSSPLQVPLVIPQVFMLVGVALICMQLVVDIASAIRIIKMRELYEF